nr:BspA family leucine-rich repeat surface protein [uncultured Blautia sp.]
MKRKKVRKKLLCFLTILGLYLLVVGTVSVYGAEDKSLEDFLGFYLCDVPDRTQLDNPEVLELTVNDKGNFVGYHRMYYSTLGTTVCYEYTDYTISGNILTCNYSRGYWPAYEDIGEDIPPGTHEYTLEDDGTIQSDGHIYYPYEKETYETTDSADTEMQQDQTEEETHYCMLADAEETDFPSEEYSEDATFLGIEGVTRKDIREVTFCDLDVTENIPSDIWDVSRDKDGTVSAWFDGDIEDGHLMIGSKEGVIANVNSKSLFRCCTNLTRISFNTSFDTIAVTSMAYMFADCKNLETIEGLENFHTENVETMKGMFLNCEKLTEVNVNDFNTDETPSISKMFEGCRSLKDINIDNFPVDDTWAVADAFKGTVREGDTPLLSRERNKNIVVSCLLDSDSILPEDVPLRVKVINCYDDILKDLASSLENFVYAVEDINGDKIPELVIMKDIDGKAYYYAYEYNTKTQSITDVQGLGFLVSESVESSNIYWFPGRNAIAYINDSGDYQILKWNKEKFEEDSVIEYKKFIDLKDRERLDFRYAYTDIIWSVSVDIDGDEEKEDVDAYAISDRNGYANIIFYADSNKVYTKEATGKTTDADIHAFTVKDNRLLIYLRMYCENTEDYCGILECENTSCKELLNMNDLVNDIQLIPNYGHSYFSVKVSEEKDLMFTFNLDSISYGEGFTFEIPYIYSKDELKQNEYLADITGKSSESYTLTQDKKVYSKIGDKKTAYTANAGEVLTPCKVWLSNGIVWIQVKNEQNETGWVPMGAESVYLELSYKYGGSVEEKVEKNKGSQVFFKDVEIPDENRLFSLGEKNFSEEKYEDAAIYYKMIGMLNHNYPEARKKAKTAEEKAKEKARQTEKKAKEETTPATSESEKEEQKKDTSQEQKKTESKKDSGEKPQKTPGKKLLEQVKKSNLNEEHPLAYCIVDLESDGVNEIIIRSYVSEGSEGGSYRYDIYQYSREKKKFLHLPYAPFFSFASDSAVYFWKEKGYIAIDCSMGELDFQVVSLDGQYIKKEYETSSDLSSLPVMKFKNLSSPKGKECKAYKQYMQSQKYLTDIQNLTDVYYSVYDLDGDGVSELISKGLDEDNKYHYNIYTCKNGQVQMLGTIVNWQNGGNGELYSLAEDGQIVVNTRLADSQTYYVYDIKGGVKRQYIVKKQSLDEKDEQGNYKRVYDYSTMDGEGNTIDKKITTDEQWNQFENSLTEVGVFPLSWDIDEIAESAAH